MCAAIKMLIYSTSREQVSLKTVPGQTSRNRNLLHQQAKPNSINKK
jgi:hypothetical protein